MRVPALITAALAAGFIAAPAAAQPYDPATATEIAAQEQAAAAADDARRAAADAQREADVARQRQETDQRIQALEARQADRQSAAARTDAEPQPPPASPGPRIATAPGALQAGKPEAKPGI